MRTPEQQRAALQTELDRLDELQRTCWPAATTDDLKAARLALKIIVERTKLLGLGRPPEDAREQQTVVIGGTSEEGLAGAALTGFSGSLLSVWWKTPGMHPQGDPRPTQQGIPLAKDVWMLAIGVSLILDALLSKDDPSEG
jgi:hypothetical protein